MKYTTVVNGWNRLGTVMSGVAVAWALMLAAGGGRALAAEPAAKDLRLFYQSHCVGCHGADGTARDAAGKSLKGQDFTDANWLKSTADAKMVKVILNGIFFGLAMPKYKTQLTQEEAQRMVTEIVRQAAKGKAIEPSPQAEAKQP